VEAVPVLLRRLAGEMGVEHVPLGCPIRQGRGHLVKRAGMEKAIELARRQPGCQAILVLFDADDLCAKTGAVELQVQARVLARQLPCPVILANKEYEAWFLASLQELGSGPQAQPYPNDPDQKRGAKEELERRLGIYYNERADQPRFSARISLECVHERSRSFRKLVKEYRALLEALGLGPREWPPARDQG
jgi:hypothetical protein